MRFVDSHVHLCDCSDPAGVLRAARVCKTLLFSSGVDRMTSIHTLQLGKEYPELVKPFVGVHPSEAGKEEGAAWVADVAPGAAGVGEIGLDPTYSNSPRTAQFETFEAQLAVVKKLGKPVQVHSRGAEKECLDVLSGFALRSVLLHWFQGEGLLRDIRDKGYYVSFGPALLYSKRLQRMVRNCDPGFVLAESDGPVPFAGLGGTSGPTLIPSVVFKLAQIWRTPYRDCGEQLLANSFAYLHGTNKG